MHKLEQIGWCKKNQIFVNPIRQGRGGGGGGGGGAKSARAEFQPSRTSLL